MRIWLSMGLRILLPLLLAVGDAGAAQDQEGPGAGRRGARKPVAEKPRPEQSFLGGYLRQSRIVYPLRVGDWEALGEQRYDTAALGASVHYRNPRMPDARLDLYIYPAGVLLEGDFAQVAARTAQEMEAVARQRDPARFEAGITREFALQDPVARLLGEHTPRPRSHVMQMGVDGAVLQSAMAIASRDMYLLKVRLSLAAEALERERVRAGAEQFLREAFAQLSIVNTGACFRPLQVVPLPADGTHAETILASTDEGTPREIRVGDERLYLAPELLSDAQALPAATAFGQSLHDALRGQCVAAEEMDIPVPDGMREIRMEYPVPVAPAFVAPGAEPDAPADGEQAAPDP